MKKIHFILLIVFAMLGVYCAEAQSTFAFRNYWNGLNAFRAPIYDAQGNLLSGSRYWVELYGGDSVDSLQPLRSFSSGLITIRTFGTGNGAGYTTGYAPGSGGEDTTVDKVGNGGYAYLQMVAWDSTLGTSYEAAVTMGVGGYGASIVFYTRGGDPTDIPPEAPLPLYGLQSFSLLAVPEPSTTVLALLGGGILFWFMRKKASVKCSAKPIHEWS